MLVLMVCEPAQVAGLSFTLCRFACHGDVTSLPVLTSGCACVLNAVYFQASCDVVSDSCVLGRETVDCTLEVDLGYGSCSNAFLVAKQHVQGANQDVMAAHNAMRVPPVYTAP